MEGQNHSPLSEGQSARSPSAPIAVIGAGIGGLSAAIRLAMAGLPVVVLEQNPRVGGKMSERSQAGFRWDTGPSVITMRWVFEELFAAAGRKLEDYLTFLPVEPLTRYFYPDGTVLDATRDLGRMTAQIEKIEPRDVEGYLAYLAYAARLHRITGPAFIYGRPPSLASFRSVSPLDTLRFDPFRSMQQAIDGFVRSPHLRQLLGRFATYVGGSPYLAPATLNVIAHVEMTGGVWYPQGGIYAIASSLERLAGELGVAVRTGCTVKQIQVQGRRVTGVELATGEVVPAQAVIANVDVAQVYEKLLPPGSVPLRTVKRLTGAEPSCSGYVLLLGIQGEHPKLAQHNILFSSNYRREFDDIFRRGIPPDEPTVYIAITSKADPSHAPPGCENWFVMVNAPALGPGFDWIRNAGAYRERVLDTLARFGLDVRGKILCEQALTPLDIERLTGARRGALYGSSSNDMLAAFRRPHNRCPDLRGLYFCGGTSHPGGGVPMVILSGKIAAQLLIEDRI
jgi:phytoene desaturase